MFTGIIESSASISKVVQEGSNLHISLQSVLAPELHIDQSLAHNGICLTVVAIADDVYTVTAVDETIKKTTIGSWKVGDRVNLERAMLAGARLDGHFVQGHVDSIAECIESRALDGSWLFRFRFPEAFAALVIEKGSICIDGVSLTAFNAGKNELTVTIIPYTYEHTNFNKIAVGTKVNMEFDVLGKYILRMKEVQS